jgi:GNAT superfamily N-acetyltransferase
MAISDLHLGAKGSLTASEQHDLDLLVREANWNQLAADWRTFLAQGRVYTASTAEGRIVASTATMPYGGRFAWISMVLVMRAYRRRGLATALMRLALDDLAAAGLVPVLDATPDGREVYRALGFQDSWSYHRLIRREPASNAPAAPMPDGVSIRAITDRDWPAVAAYDAAAFGAPRGAVLGGLRGRLPAAELVATRGEVIVGFMLGRDGRIAGQLGPLAAEDDAIAMALIGRALAAHAGPLFIDLADAKTQVRAFVETQGFSAVRPLTRMLLGTSARFDDAQRTFAVVGPELG